MDNLVVGWWRRDELDLIQRCIRRDVLLESGRHPFLSPVDMLLRNQIFPDSTRHSISRRLFDSCETKMQTDGEGGCGRSNAARCASTTECPIGFENEQ